jgi:putative lipoprotein
MVPGFRVETVPIRICNALRYGCPPVMATAVSPAVSSRTAGPAVRGAIWLALLCAGCAAAVDAGPQPGLVPYACGEGTAVAHFSDDAVALALPDADLRLPQAVAASGARYEGDGTLFWIKGDEALLERPGAPALTCTVGPPAHWRDAAGAGVDLRAVGQEPGWLLDIDAEGVILLRADYGETVLSVPAPLPRAEGGTLSWHARTQARRPDVTAPDVTAPDVTAPDVTAPDVAVLDVAVEERVCRDVMSGQPYPLAVTVALDGRTLDGCGAWLR